MQYPIYTSLDNRQKQLKIYHLLVSYIQYTVQYIRGNNTVTILPDERLGFKVTRQHPCQIRNTAQILYIILSVLSAPVTEYYYIIMLILI